MSFLWLKKISETQVSFLTEEDQISTSRDKLNNNEIEYFFNDPHILDSLYSNENKPFLIIDKCLKLNENWLEKKQYNNKSLLDQVTVIEDYEIQITSPKYKFWIINLVPNKEEGGLDIKMGNYENEFIYAKSINNNDDLDGFKLAEHGENAAFVIISHFKDGELRNDFNFQIDDVLKLKPSCLILLGCSSEEAISRFFIEKAKQEINTVISTRSKISPFELKIPSFGNYGAQYWC